MALGTLLTIGIITFLIVSAFVGFVRGSKKALFRFITVAFSAAAAFVAVVIFKNLLGEEAATAKINALLAQNGLQKILDIASASPIFEEVILKTVGGMIAPIIFFIVFLAFSVLTYVLYFIITLIFGIFKKHKTAKSRAGGKTAPAEGAEAEQASEKSAEEKETAESTAKESQTAEDNSVKNTEKTAEEENVKASATEKASEKGAEKTENTAESADVEDERSGCLSGIFALLLGFAQGIVVTAALVLTIISYTLIVPEIAPKLEGAETFNESQRGTVTDLTKTVDEANNAALISVYRKCGLDLAAHGLMDYEIKLENETVKVGMASEISSIADLVFTFMDLTASPIAEYGEAEGVLIQKLGKTFTESRVLSLAGSELLHSATESWKKGEPFAGMAKPDLGADFNPLITKLIETFNESTKSPATFNEDVITTANLVAVFAKNGIFSASTQLESNPDALFDCIAKDGVISEITLTLNTNARMSTLVPEITNLGLKTLANSLGIAENTTEIYTETLSNIVTHINSTKEETDATKRAEALKPLLKTEFENIGVTIEPEYLDILAPALIEDFGSFDGEITPDFIAEFFDVYSNTVSSGTVQLSGGTASVLPLAATEGKTYTFPKYASGTLTTGAVNAANQSLALIGGATPEKLNAFKVSDALLSGMRSSATATINRATIKDFLVDSGCVITNPEAESAALEAIVKEVVYIMNVLKAPEGNGIEIIKSFSSRLGGALDSLSKTEMYGSDKTFTLFTAILQSKTLRDTTKITVPETIKLTGKHRANADKVSFGSLMNVLTSTVDVITSMQKSEVTTDSIQGLIGNLTPENSEIIKEVITVERMEEMGIPKENAETTTELMGDLIGNLGKIENPETYEQEAKAVENIINLGIAAKDALTGNNGGSGDGSGEGGGEGTPETPKKNLFTPTVNKDEGGSGDGSGSGSGDGTGSDTPAVEEGSLGCTADDMVNNIMSSSAVCDTIVSTAKDKETVDPFGISGSLTESDEQAIKDACDNYVNQNSDKSPEEMEKITETLDSITKLLGITGWTAPTFPVPTP